MRAGRRLADGCAAADSDRLTLGGWTAAQCPARTWSAAGSTACNLCAADYFLLNLSKQPEEERDACVACLQVSNGTGQ